jgi:hypothetical protein
MDQPEKPKFTRQGVNLDDLILLECVGEPEYDRIKKEERMSAKRKARVPGTDGSRG